MNEIELKMCPFCEDADVPERVGYNDVECPECGARVDILVWQNRPLEDALKLKVEEARLVLRGYEAFHPRAIKLIKRRKNFLVVSEDEPYFLAVYTKIRDHETNNGTWTEEDEAKFKRYQRGEK